MSDLSMAFLLFMGFIVVAWKGFLIGYKMAIRDGTRIKK